MPANLPPQYYEAEERYRLARTNEEKLSILKEMWAIMPKHKGTDKLQGELKAKVSQLKKEIKKRPPRKKSSSLHIPKQGAARVALLGAPNVGKSQILNILTNAESEVADYPFTTREPFVGMMPFEDIRIQLIDTPPLTEEAMSPIVKEIIQNTDLILLIVDLGSEELLEQMDIALKNLEELNIINNSSLKKVLIVGNKEDRGGSKERLEILKDIYKEKLPLISISAKELKGVEKLKRKIYEMLDIIRVYTKAPGKPFDERDPVILKKGDKVLDAAISIHKDFARTLKYTRMWRKNKFEGKRVEKGEPLEDKDIVEFHI